MDKNTALLKRIIQELPAFNTHAEIYAAFPEGCPVLFRFGNDLSVWYQGTVKGVTEGITFNHPGSSWNLLVEIDRSKVNAPHLGTTHHYSTISVPLILNTSFHCKKLTEDHVGVKYADSVIEGLKLCQNIEEKHIAVEINPFHFVWCGKVADPVKVIAFVKLIKQ